MEGCEGGKISELIFQSDRQERMPREMWISWG